MRANRPPRPGLTGTWFQAPGPAGGDRGVLRLNLEGAPVGAAQRLAAAVRAVNALDYSGFLPHGDVIQHDGGLWLVTAQPASPTLVELARSGIRGIDVGSIATIVNETAQSLAELHQAGLWHGGLSGDTVVVTSTGAAKLAEAALLPALRGHQLEPSVGAATDRRAWAELVRAMVVEWGGSGPAADLMRQVATIGERDLNAAVQALHAGAAVLPKGFSKRGALLSAVAAFTTRAASQAATANAAPAGAAPPSETAASTPPASTPPVGGAPVSIPPVGGAPVGGAAAVSGAPVSTPPVSTPPGGGAAVGGAPVGGAAVSGAAGGGPASSPPAPEATQPTPDEQEFATRLAKRATAGPSARSPIAAPPMGPPASGPPVSGQPVSPYPPGPYVPAPNQYQPGQARVSWPAAPPDVHYGPAAGPGPQGAGAWPGAPVARVRRRHSPLKVISAVLSALIALVLLGYLGASIAGYTNSSTLQLMNFVSVNSIRLEVPSPGNECDVRLTVTGIFVTDGRSGTIRFQWEFPPQGDGAPKIYKGSVHADRGVTEVRTTALWTLTGVGTGDFVATLRLLKPGTGTASTTVKYNCQK
jgi:hypothetical protein